MQRPERFGWRAFARVAVFLCLALLGVAAQASIAEMPEARRMLESAAASHGTSAGDCMPCAGCYVARAASAHEFRGESKEHEAPRWRIHAALASNLPGWFETRRPHAPVPVRIAFCRWLV
jgi:hypothetical protein